MEFKGISEHIVVLGGVPWPAVDIGHADPGTGCINNLVDNSVNFLM